MPDTLAAGIPPSADTVGLVGPVWRLVEFRGGDETRLTPDDQDGKPFFTATESHPVLTRGNPDSVSLLLRRAEPRSPATLENTYWKATAIGDRPARVAENIPEPHSCFTRATPRPAAAPAATASPAGIS